MTPRHTGIGKLWLLNIVANAALMVAVYLWLVLPDMRAWQVALSAVLALVIIFCALWLRTGTFAYFRLTEFRENGTVWDCFRRTRVHILPFLLWTVPLACVEWCLFQALRYAPQFGVWIWQKAPFLRIGSPRTMNHIAEWCIGIAMFLALACWLPIASSIAASGLRSHNFGRSLRVVRHGAYWLWLIGLVVVGGYLPYRLIWWVPDITTLTGQAWSAGLRLAVAYLIVVSAWIALLFEVGMRVETEDRAS